MSNHFLSSTPDELQESLNDLNRKMQEEEAQAQSRSLGLPYINLHNFPVDLSVLGIFTEEEARISGSLPFFKDSKDLKIATISPNNQLLKQKILELSKKHNVSVYFISKKSFEQTLKYYAKVIRPKQATEDLVVLHNTENFFETLKILQDTKEQVKLNGTRLLEVIFGIAIAYKASDIHLEPENHFFKLRLRVDGVLQDILHIDKSLEHTIVSRIKILSKLKLNVETLPQDGRMSFSYSGALVDVRVSVLPSAYGEEIVMRVLGVAATNLKVAELGFRKNVLEKLEHYLARPNGMIITTGPTGSGKTTSLYSFLNQLNKPGVKIITLEDPVEYKLEGIVQTPIDHNHDFDFAKGLRAVLRQDPDIVMVGEIRDQETAETALQAALTGHLVFSTLHTNDAAGAIPRLLNMGIKPFIAAPALSCVLAQRLVRKLCSDCKKPASVSPVVMEKILYALNKLPKEAGFNISNNLVFYHSTGCQSCGGFGYKGRLGIYELLENTEEIQKLILAENTSMAEFKKVAVSSGMLTMLQDGLLKALDGLTDIEEVFRVVGEV